MQGVWLRWVCARGVVEMGVCKGCGRDGCVQGVWQMALTRQAMPK